MRPAFLAAIALVPALAACQTAPDGAYPSLAIRDVERAQGQLEPVPGDPIDVPPVEVPLDGPLDQRLAALVEQGRSAHARFTAAAPRAEIAGEIDMFNNAVRDRADKAGTGFIDIIAISRRAADEPELVASDGLHPSGRMYSEWVELIYPKVIRVVDATD